MARQLWLGGVLRGAGLTVHEYDGWRARGLESFGPVLGVICHHTGSSPNATDAGDLRQLAVTGTPSAPTVPISQLYLSRSGAWWVIASGTATGVKTGTGGPLKGRGDDAVLQIEAQHGGGSEAWTEVQYRSYVRGVAALVRQLGCTVDFVVGHKEHQPGQKDDPNFDMDTFRADVAAVLNGDDDMGEWTQPTGNLTPDPDGYSRTGEQKTNDLYLATFWGTGVPVTMPDGSTVEKPYLVDMLERILAGLKTPAPAEVDYGKVRALVREESEAAVKRVLGAIDGATPK